MHALWRIGSHLNLSSRRTVSALYCRATSTKAASVSDRERQHFLLELSSQSLRWNVSPENVMKAVKNCPELLKFSPSEWNTVFYTFENVGFKGDETLEVVQKCPRLLATDPESIVAIWDALTIFKLSTSKLVSALVAKPYILCNSPKDADDKALEIINFAGAKNNALRVLTICDNPFALSIEELKEVIMYVQEVMKVRRTMEICRSKVVECPILKLKCRHSFLVDCGLYTPQNKNIPVTIRHSNPLLCDIVNCNDEVFAVRTAKLTYEEYLIYQELFEKKRYDEIYEEVDDL